jgi:hypothetical protein
MKNENNEPVIKKATILCSLRLIIKIYGFKMNYVDEKSEMKRTGAHNISKYLINIKITV